MNPRAYFLLFSAILMAITAAYAQALETNKAISPVDQKAIFVPVYRYIKNWEVGCDNLGRCTALTANSHLNSNGYIYNTRCWPGCASQVVDHPLWHPAPKSLFARWSTYTSGLAQMHAQPARC
ncbi:hypothetical protein [Acidithiobacillus sp.]